MNSGFLSTNRAMSHGQAMRSILGRWRVTHFIGASSGEGFNLATTRSPTLLLLRCDSGHRVVDEFHALALVGDQHGEHRLAVAHLWDHRVHRAGLVPSGPGDHIGE